MVIDPIKRNTENYFWKFPVGLLSVAISAFTPLVTANILPRHAQLPIRPTHPAHNRCAHDPGKIVEIKSHDEDLDFAVRRVCPSPV